MFLKGAIFSINLIMGEVKDVAAALGRALNEVKKYLLLRQYRMCDASRTAITSSTME